MKLLHYILIVLITILVMPVVAFSASFTMWTVAYGEFTLTHESTEPFTYSYTGTNAGWNIDSSTARVDYLNFGIEAKYSANDPYGGVATIGEYKDTWTVNGAEGSGILKFMVALDGSYGGAWNGLWEKYTYSFSYKNKDGNWMGNTFWNGSWVENTVSGTNGNYAVNESLEFLIPFTFGTPFEVDASFGVNAYPRWSSVSGSTNAFFDFFNTAEIIGIAILDTDQNPVYGTSVYANDTTLLASQPAPVPVPASFLLLSTGIGMIGSAAWRRKNA